MNRIEGAISANLASLWKQEDELIGWSLGVVAKHEHLIDHFSSIDLYLDAIDFGRQQKMETRRHIAINGLFLRTFDSLSHGLRANLCGNYTGGAMYARDLLETNFLIDFLLDDPERVLIWMDADQKKIKKDFKPVHIRETLDKRDGFTKLKRAKAYEALSQFGAHPTPSSFAMKKDGSGDITSGPLRNEELLIAMIEELAKVTLTLSTILNVYLSEVPGTGFYQSLLLIRAQKSQHFISMADEIAMSLGRVRSALRKPFLIQP